MFLIDLMEKGLMSREEIVLAGKSIIVKASNVAEYICQTPNRKYTVKDFPNIASPFPLMWMEWSQAVDDKQKARFGLLVNSSDFDEVKTFVPEWTAKMETHPRWICTGLLFGEVDGELLGTIKIRWAVSSDGEAMRNGIMVESEPDKEYSPAAMQQTCSSLTVPWMALSFMHCKNIELVKSPSIPEALAKARKRRGEVPLVRFHTINILPIKRKIAGLTGTGKITPAALHFCRGHFKDFSLHGLFGKNKGVYWWPMNLRGSADHGIVKSDYDVKAKVDGSGKL